MSSDWKLAPQFRIGLSIKPTWNTRFSSSQFNSSISGHFANRSWTCEHRKSPLWVFAVVSARLSQKKKWSINLKAESLIIMKMKIRAPRVVEIRLRANNLFLNICKQFERLREPDESNKCQEEEFLIVIISKKMMCLSCALSNTVWS